MRFKLGIVEWFAMVQILITFVPYIAFITPSGFNVIVTLLFFFLLIGKLGVDKTVRIFNKFFLVFLFVIVDIFISNNVFLSVYQFIQLLSWTLLIDYLQRSAKQNNFKLLLILVTVCYAITMITTIIGNETYQGISRAKAAGETVGDKFSEDILNGHNIGGFGFVYTVVLFIPLLLYWFRNSHGTRIIALALIILTFYTIIKTEYTTALLVAVSSLILLFIPKNISASRINLIVIGGVIFLIIGGSFIAPYLQKVSSIISSETIGIRFNEMSSVLGGKEYTGTDLGTRIAKWTASLTSFFTHPLTGSRNIGGHSFILDKMGLYGLWGLIGIILFLRSIYKNYVSPYYQSTLYGTFYMAFIMEIILIMTNTYFAYNFFLLILPLFSIVFSNDNNTVQRH